MKRLAIKALFAQLVLLGSLGILWAQQDTNTNQDQPAADNTKAQIRRLPDKSEPTADQQKEIPRSIGSLRSKFGKRLAS